MRVLVTGGAGFIGSHLVDALLARGATVVVLDNFSTGRHANLAGKPLQLVEADVADLDAVCRAAAGCELILHQAALASVPRALAEPALNYRSNISGTFNVLEAARRAGVARVVYASSSAVYGPQTALPLDETLPPNPISPYAMAKLVGEELARSYARSYGLSVVCLRYMNVYGPRQDPGSPYSGVISIFVTRALAGRPVTIYGDGAQTRDFVYVGDVVAANLAAAALATGDAPAIINIGSGVQTSVSALYAQVAALLPTAQPATYAAARAGDIAHSVAATAHAQRLLAWQARTPLHVGLQATIEWARTEEVTA